MSNNLMNNDEMEKIDDNVQYSFLPYKNNEPVREMHAHILEYNADILILAFISIDENVDLYDTTTYDISIIKKVIDAWKFFCTAKSFDEVFEKFTRINYLEKQNENNICLNILNSSGKQLWENRSKDIQTILAFDEWYRKIVDFGCDSVKFMGL